MSVLYLIGLGIASSSCNEALAEQGAAPKDVTAKGNPQDYFYASPLFPSWARYELLISNRQTVYKTDIALIAEFL